MVKIINLINIKNADTYWYARKLIILKKSIYKLSFSHLISHTKYFSYELARSFKKPRAKIVYKGFPEGFVSIYYIPSVYHKFNGLFGPEK